MNDIMWKDDRGQWWFFAGVESTLVDFHPPCGKGHPPYIECNTGQEVVGMRVKAPDSPARCVGLGFNLKYHAPGPDDFCTRCGVAQ
jgi:hypothetical protein